VRYNELNKYYEFFIFFLKMINVKDRRNVSLYSDIHLAYIFAELACFIHYWIRDGQKMETKYFSSLISSSSFFFFFN